MTGLAEPWSAMCRGVVCVLCEAVQLCAEECCVQLCAEEFHHLEGGTLHAFGRSRLG